MEIIKKKIKDLNLAAYNPRVGLQPSDEEYQAIKRSLGKYGLVQPIVWNRRTNTVVGGHQRLRVLTDMGIQETDVSVVDLDPIAEKQLNVALNKVEGKWDDRKLSEILLELGDDALQTGFTLPEIEVLQNQVQTLFDEEEESPVEPETPRDFFLLTLSFDKADEKDIKTYIKKNGEEGIVRAIIRKARGEK